MNLFDIYYYPWIFEEDLLDSNLRFKDRPVLILSDGNLMFIAICKITGTESNNFEIIDWEDAGLTKPSYIDFRRKVIADKSKFGNKVGRLSNKDILRIKSNHLNENSSINNLILEDTIKQGNSWVNKGKDGTHGKFKTKKEADALRKAMYALGYKG